MAGLWPLVAATCFGLVWPPTSATTHYERPPCQADEVQGEVLGLSGYVCAPRCAEGSYDCPGDVPGDASGLEAPARPQCMLKDADRGAYCALLCVVQSSQCPSGAHCNKLPQAGVGVCMYPLGFSDWVHQGKTHRLSYGLPQRADRKVPQGVVQKAVAAVQSLKSKYTIPDGDADVVTVKEFLSSLSGTAGSGVASLPAAPSWPSASSAVAASQWQPPPAAQPYRPPVPEGQKILNAYEHDLAYHSARLSEGIPGLEKEVTNAIYHVEHITEKHNAADLLRNIIEFFLLYLIIGAVYKSQALGASGMDMIPHIGFWIEYPRLVQDGMEFSKQTVGSFLGMDFSSMDFSASGSSGGFGGLSGNNGFEPLGKTGERDTFANFEPTKL